MAITMAPYAVNKFNNLFDFSDALPKFDKLDGQRIANEDMQELFRRHKVENILGLALLHRHSLLDEEERLTDVRGTSNPLTFAAGQPSVWKFDSDGQKLAPLEFSIEQREVNWQDPNMQAFLAEFFDLVKKMDAIDVLGLCGYPGDGYPGRVEFTTGRSNVNLTPDEAHEYLSGLVGGTREAAWFYTDDFQKRGCSLILLRASNQRLPVTLFHGPVNVNTTGSSEPPISSNLIFTIEKSTISTTIMSTTNTTPDDKRQRQRSSSHNAQHQDQHGQDDDGRLARQPSTAESAWIAESLSLPREALFVAVICMAQFCTQAAYLGTLVLLGTIGESFHVTSAPRLAWLVAGYSLTVATFILFSGRLGDVFGYKRMLIGGLAWFSLWSLVAGLSVFSNYKLAVLSRVLQGIGPAICLPNALAILGAAYPQGHRKAMVFALFGAVAPIGGVFGGIFAALFTLAWWPWALWAMAIWLAVLALAARYAIPDLPSGTKAPLPPQRWRDWIETLDLPGAVVGVVALVLFNFAWTQAPIDGWGTPTILVPLVLGLLMMLAFGYIEFRVSPKPLLPFSAVNADVAFVLAAVACGWATFGIWTLYLVQLLQHVRGLSPLLTSVWFLPPIFSGACAAVVTGKLLGPLQVRPPYVMIMALAAFTVGAVMMATAPADQTYWGQTFVSLLIMPFGMDMSFPAATLILSNAVPKQHQGVGASLVNTVVNYGIALGVGFAGTVEVHVQGAGDTLDDRFRGYRGALFMAVGTAGLGLLVSCAFLARQRWLTRGHVV
ncbi:hypothetical protein E4U41_007017 [Claviceps citrina]|nr:hypothetical protein E4U41_007017 [Claviceps citrina]